MLNCRDEKNNTLTPRKSWINVPVFVFATLIFLPRPAGAVTYFHYNANGVQDASWYYWDNPGAGNDKRVLNITDYDAQGRAVKTRRTVDEELTNPATDIETKISGTSGTVLSRTIYNSIGKTDATYDEFGNYTKYDYDETGNLIETRTYAPDVQATIRRYCFKDLARICRKICRLTESF